MELKDILLWIHVVLQVFGVVGHVLSVMVLAERTLRSSTSLYLTMMSLFNCLFLVLSLYRDLDGVESSDLTVPKSVMITILSTIGICSIYTTVAVTIERYVAVAYPLKAHALCTVSSLRNIGQASLVNSGCACCPDFVQMGQSDKRNRF
ncbi:FMRFamide receptor-like [Gigantopelta aegis]|uniref:FMRFamide receptor-like n=1 Tax=Gigantopelta aegis TaxID=1735272 RepID=UPI001B88C81B|nr:FMRFamide receptor-like [Gigantopelta aegis]